MMGHPYCAGATLESFGEHRGVAVEPRVGRRRFDAEERTRFAPRGESSPRCRGYLCPGAARSAALEALSHPHYSYFRGVANATEIKEVIRERLRGLKDTGLGDTDEARPSPANAPN